jgi:hypothetical protein
VLTKKRNKPPLLRKGCCIRITDRARRARAPGPFRALCGAKNKNPALGVFFRAMPKTRRPPFPVSRAAPKMPKTSRPPNPVSRAVLRKDARPEKDSNQSFFVGRELKQPLGHWPIMLVSRKLDNLVMKFTGGLQGRSRLTSRFRVAFYCRRVDLVCD